jgi:dienelactone hydrolase
MTSPTSFDRRKIRFPGGDRTYAGWHYPGRNGACLVMAGGLGVTREPATDRLAPRFQAAGFSVLAIDFRGLGESDGSPRLVLRARDQQADLHAAIAFARTLPEVDPERVVLWGFSYSGGHVFPVAAGEPRLAAAIAQAPLADGPASMPNALRSMTPLAALRLNARAVLDGVHSGWRQEVTAGSALAMGFYRPGRAAPRVSCPMLVLAYEDDRSALPGPAVRAGERAPAGEVVRLAGDHYTSMTDGLEQAVALQLDFLARHVVGAGRLRPAAAAA